MKKIMMDSFSAECPKLLIALLSPFSSVSLTAFPTPFLLPLLCLSVSFSPFHVSPSQGGWQVRLGLTVGDWEPGGGQCLAIQPWDGVIWTKES